MRFYLMIWALVILVLGYEYYALSFQPQMSLLYRAQIVGLVSRERRLETASGGWLGQWVGWLGFGFMVVMNAYSIRKRFLSAHSFGRLSQWLNFHVFCGLVGPTFIFFHSNLRVRGIVGISFWSMVISFTSGLVGRYFYIQVAGKKAEIEKAAERWLHSLDRILKKQNLEPEQATKDQVKQKALLFVGAARGNEQQASLTVLVSAIAGDLRSLFGRLVLPQGWPAEARVCLMQYAFSMRQANFLEPFQRLLKHWHAFHFPFAVFMYLAAIVHIISSLIFLRSHG
ncbi:MAG: hypothetical protein C5B49_03595 [Bdellovibrio sp.]|nr:MAG: hypothetical protein C5B49_03595 [Bdellovibrio sp.]